MTVVTLASTRARTVYHSPDSPGYSSWLGAWSWPGTPSELGFAFTQVTGVPNGSGGFSSPPQYPNASAPRVSDPTSWDDRVRLSHQMRTVQTPIPASTAVVLSSPVPARSFTGPPHSESGQPTTRLADGRYIMRVNDEDRAAVGDNDGPETAYIQFYDPSATTPAWGPRIYPSNSSTTTAQFTRCYEVGDRLFLSGNLWRVAPDTRTGTTTNEWGLWYSDDGGASWTEALTNANLGTTMWANEWDWAMLPNGNIFGSFRTLDADDWNATPRVKTPVRKQALLTKSVVSGKDKWTIGTPTFKSTLAATAPQHPCLMPLNGGTVILHIAQDTGVHYTTDRGTTWTLLLANPKCLYYPNAVLHTDGLVYVFSHFGGDDDWGEKDERVDVLILEVLIDGEPPEVEAVQPPQPPNAPSVQPASGTYENEAGELNVTIGEVPGSTIRFTWAEAPGMAVGPGSPLAGSAQILGAAEGYVFNARAFDNVTGVASTTTTRNYTIRVQEDTGMPTIVGEATTGTVVNDSTLTPGTAFTSPSNATTENSTYATMAIGTGGTNNQTAGGYARTGTHSYPAAVPDAAQITKITAEVTAYRSTVQKVHDRSVRLASAGSIVGGNRAITFNGTDIATYWQAAPVTRTYVWEGADLPALTGAQVKDTSFGVVYAPENLGSEVTFNLDSIIITEVQYVESARTLTQVLADADVQAAACQDAADALAALVDEAQTLA